MADVLLGVANSLVQGTIVKVQSAIEESSKLQQSAQNDLVFIVGEFEMMQSFLSCTSQNITNNVMGTFVAQVLDLAYDVEDNIEFIVHLDTMSESDRWWRMIPSCMRPQLPLDEAVGTIAQLKVRVQDVIQRKERYTLTSDSGGPNPVNETKQLHNVSSSFDVPAEAGSSTMNQQEMDALTKLVTKRGSHRQVISVWTLGGNHGAECKSIIWKAYNNSKIWQDFSCRAWVKLSSPFNLPDFYRSLTDQFRGAGPVKDDHIADEFKEQVNNRYLVVLEDLSTKEDWGTIIEKLPDKSNNSCIVVLTEQYQVASFCTGLRYIQHFWADYSGCTFYEEVPANNTLIGRTSDINQLPGYLAKARINELHVMSVWGIPGSGKSALVRNFYHEMAHLFEEHGWVNLSHPFNLRDFSRSLLLQFNSHSLEANEALDPVEQCRNILKDRRCLVVIDDLNLQLKQEWGKIRAELLSRPTESVIIVITNEEKIAFDCADRRDLVFNVKALGVEAAIGVFKTKVQNPFPVDDMDNEVVLQQLIRKCGGLPKVIVALAEILSPVYNWRDKANMLNDNFVLNLEAMPESDCLHGLFSWMQSYFDALPMDFRKLVAYLLIFPGHSSTRRRRLVMRWGAEGYSTDSESHTADENGEEHFSGLVNQAMIQPPPLSTITNMRMVSFTVNAIFREYMISRPLKDNIATAIELFVLKGTCSPTSRRRGRHLVIEQSWTRDRIVFGKIDFSRLRSLTVFGQWESFFISEGMKVLRVLDLEDASGVTNKDLQNILKLLPRLKFLSLRGCSEISYLPSSVGELRQLQILDVRYSSIVTIPMSITKLKKLQYIRAGPIAPIMDPSGPCTVAFKLSELQTCLRLAGVNVMSGIGKLSALHTLGVINVGGIRGKFILKELRSLTQLRKLGVSGVSKKNGKELCSAVSCHSRLQSLTVWLKEDNENCLDSMFPDTAVKPSDPKKFLSLKLYGPLKNLPMWIRHLCNLRKLNLEVDVLLQDDIGVLGNLQQLCILRLRVNPPQAAPAIESAASDPQAERTVTQLQETDHGASEPKAERTVTQPQGIDHGGSEPQAERAVTQPQGTGHRASELNFFVVERAVTQPQGTDHRASEPQAERAVTQPQGTDHRASELNFFVAERAVTQPQGTNHRASELNFFVVERVVTQPQGTYCRASEPQAEMVVTQPQGTDHRATEPQVERAVTQPQGTDQRASELNFYVAERAVIQPRGTDHRASELNICVMTNGVEDRCYRKIQVLEIASRSLLHLSIGKEAMENLEVLKAGCCSIGSLPQFGSLDHLKKLKEVQVIGSFNDSQKRDLKQHFEEVNISAQASIAESDERCSFPF